MSGKVRNLVPYFVPGQGDTVNETLSPYATTPPKSSPPRVSVNVRKWDHAEGYFKDAVQVIHDHDKPTPQVQSVETQSPRLLTPAEIRQARRKAMDSSPPRTRETSNSPRNIKHVDPSPKTPTSRTSPSVKSKGKPASPPGKPRPFAGSTFEAASPPPAGLPIPGFVKSRKISEPLSETVHDRDRAAVDLKRILRI